jgi:transposase
MSLQEQHEVLDRSVRAIAMGDNICCRLMSIPGVGPITALSFVVAIDDPARFTSSRVVAAYLGLTPRVFQSGVSLKSGGISHRGDSMTRKTLVAAARTLLLKAKTDCALKRWGLQIAKSKGYKIAYIAVARKLAVLMHHLWITGEDFDPAR